MKKTKKLLKISINQKFGRLIVIKRLPNDTSKRTKWICKCDCGKEIIVTSHDLSRKDGKGTKSCGCYLRDINRNRLFKGTKNISHTYFTSLRNGAKARKIDFNIKIEYIQELLEQQDYKCALSNLNIQCSKNTNKNSVLYQEQTASLDRIDNSKGYIIGNVQWVHKNVNIIKRELNEKDFISLCGSIYKTATTRIKRFYRYNETEILHKALQSVEEDNLQSG